MYYELDYCTYICSVIEIIIRITYAPVFPSLRVNISKTAKVRVLTIKHTQDDSFNEIMLEENACVLQLKGFLWGHHVLLGDSDRMSGASNPPVLYKQVRSRL